MAYVDNSNLLAAGRTTKDAYRILEKAYIVCLKWGTKYGFCFNPSKYHAIYFSKPGTARST